MVLKDLINAEWEQLPSRFPNSILDAFVIMPNYFHGIIFLSNLVAATLAVAGEAGANPAVTIKTDRFDRVVLI
jgi:hypothetical protein